jgi:uncharacterized phiE125 gp8 family phage protein
MISGDPLVPGAAALGDARTYLRIEGVEEDGLVGRLVGTAAELCERFTGQALIARGFTETLASRGSWMRLGVTPVGVIAGVEALGADGVATPLAPDAYAIDIDANGDGWVRISQSLDAARVRVSYQAGLATEWTALPEALRQGVARLVAHLFTHRDTADGGGPPAAVTALWRPWRRMRLR